MHLTCESQSPPPSKMEAVTFTASVTFRMAGMLEVLRKCSLRLLPTVPLQPSEEGLTPQRVSPGREAKASESSGVGVMPAPPHAHMGKQRGCWHFFL